MQQSASGKANNDGKLETHLMNDLHDKLGDMVLYKIISSPIINL